MLCQKCSNIHFEKHERHPFREKRGSELDLDFYSGYLLYFHYDSVHDLRASAEEGCHFCAILLDAFLEHVKVFPRTTPDTWASGEVILKRRILKRRVNLSSGRANWWSNLDDWIHAYCGDTDTLRSMFFLQDYTGSYITGLIRKIDSSF